MTKADIDDLLLDLASIADETAEEAARAIRELRAERNRLARAVNASQAERASSLDMNASQHLRDSSNLSSALAALLPGDLEER